MRSVYGFSNSSFYTPKVSSDCPVLKRQILKKEKSNSGLAYIQGKGESRFRTSAFSHWKHENDAKGFTLGEQLARDMKDISYMKPFKTNQENMT